MWFTGKIYLTRALIIQQLSVRQLIGGFEHLNEELKSMGDTLMMNFPSVF